MKRLALLASVSTGALLAAASPAHALFGVGDIVSDPGSYVLQHLGLANQATEIGKWVQQLQAMQQQYQTLQYQLQAVAHLPQNVTSTASSLATVPSLQNPLPQANQLQGILSGSSFGSLRSLGTAFSTANTVFNPTGTDYGATTMLSRRNGWAGIQALATNNIQSLQQQSTALGAFLSEIGKSPDVAQSGAIQARLQLDRTMQPVSRRRLPTSRRFRRHSKAFGSSRTPRRPARARRPGATATPAFGATCHENDGSRCAHDPRHPDRQLLSGARPRLL